MIRKRQATFIRVLTAITLAWNSLAFAARPGDLVPGGHRSPEGAEVRYQGQTDSVGRELVYAPKGSVENPSFRNGILQTDGSIQWDGAFNSRLPGQKYPNYPEARGNKSPLPRNRSLVPSGSITDLPRTREYLPEFDPANQPSQLRQYIDNMRDWTAAQRRNISKAKDAFRNSDGLNGLADASSKLVSRVNGNKGKILGYGAGFFVAMGFVAAYQLMTEHSQNPAAWSAFLDTSLSPVGAASFAGFIAGAWAFEKVVAKLPNGKNLPLLPRFGGILLAGSLVSTPISIIGNNPDFKACYGFDAYSKTGKFTMDEAACDRLSAWINSSPSEQGFVFEIANTYVPYAASLLAAGGVYLGIYASGAFVINKIGLANWLRQLAMNKENIRGGGWIGVAAVIVFHMTLFMLAQTITDSLFDVEKSVREFLVATKGLFGHFYGSSIQESETNILREWARIKANGWKDPYSWNKVCYDEKRSYQLFYNCEAPDQLDLPGLLSRYGKLQASWRGIQLQDTMGAYQQWVLKVGNFNSMAAASYFFYQSAVRQVQETGHLNLTELEAALKTSWPQIAGSDVPDAWSKVKPLKMSEFLLASMACGPELDGYKSTGWWDATRQKMKSIIGRTGPDKLIDNKDGFTAKFFPPRITTPLDGTTATVCEHSARWIPQLFGQSIYAFPVESRGQVVTGLIQYVQENLRASASTSEAFDVWWSEKVATGLEQVQNDMRAEYREMLEKIFKPSLVRNDYRWCEPGRVKGTGVEKIYRQLVTTNETCGGEAVSRLSYGVLANLKDEVRLYLALAIDLYLSNVSRIGGPVKKADGSIGFAESMDEYEKALIPRAQTLLAKYDEYTRQLTVIDPQNRADAAQMENELSQVFTEIRDVVYSGALLATKPGGQTVTIAGQTATMPDIPAYQLTWMKALLDQIVLDLNGAQAYYKLLTAMDGAEGK